MLINIIKVPNSQTAKTTVIIKNNLLMAAFVFLKKTRNPKHKMKNMLNKGKIWGKEKLEIVIFIANSLSIFYHSLLSSQLHHKPRAFVSAFRLCIDSSLVGLDDVFSDSEAYASACGVEFLGFLASLEVLCEEMGEFF